MCVKLHCIVRIHIPYLKRGWDFLTSPVTNPFPLRLAEENTKKIQSSCRLQFNLYILTCTRLIILLPLSTICLAAVWSQFLRHRWMLKPISTIALAKWLNSWRLTLFWFLFYFSTREISYWEIRVFIVYMEKVKTWPHDLFHGFFLLFFKPLKFG